MVCRLSSFALAATVVLIASHAAAAPTTENVRLQYKRPVACPNEADLRARVSALTAKVSFVSKNDRAPDAALLDIAIAESDGGYVGNLSFHRATTDEATERLVQDLFVHFIQMETLPPGYEGVQGAVDYVAGMTDRFAIETYQRLHVPVAWQ